MSTRLPNLIPPFRYTMVEEDLFRGGFPKPRNYRFLKRLRLKTILSLIPDKPTPDLQEFCERENIHMLRLTVDRMKEDNIPLSYNKTILALQIIIDPENHPLYVHCLDGADVTGLVIACLRRLQLWSLSSALLEFSRNLHTSVISSEESEFVENFKNFEVTIPMSIRRWLWGGKVNFRKHATLRLKFLNPEMMTDEERELKDKEERREKDKEDFYKKRKNDLLDNLFDSTTLASSRTHRTSSVYTSNQNTGNTSNNSSTIGGVGSGGGGGGGNSSKGQGTSISGISAGGSSTIGSHSNSTTGSAATNSKAGSPSMMSDDFEFSSPNVMVTGMEDSHDDDIDNTSDNDQGEEDDVDIDDDDDGDGGDVGVDDKENDHRNDNGSGGSSGSGGDNSSTKENRRRHRSDKNQYLVDVDVDVENVMMDGLDQVQYYNRSSSYFGNDTGSFYIGENSDNTMMTDELGTIYDEGPASRYPMEPISRTLEALALEGLD